MIRTLSIAIVLIILALPSASLSSDDSLKTNAAKEKGEVVAEVNDHKIYLSELNDELSNIPENVGLDASSSVGKRAVLDKLIDRTLLLQEIENEGLENDPQVIEKIELQKEQLLINEFIARKFGAQLQISEEEVRNFYEQNKQNLITPEKRSVRHIVVPTQEKAEEIRELLLNGADFAEMVEKHSSEDFRADGGQLGYIEKAKFIPEFSGPAFNLKLNEFSKPVQTQFGYHIIQVLDIQPAQYLDYESIKEDLKNAALQQKTDQILNAYIQKLRASSDIIIRGSMLAESSNYRMETKSIQPVLDTEETGL